jgi:hypothetical protein
MCCVVSYSVSNCHPNLILGGEVRRNPPPGQENSGTSGQSRQRIKSGQGPMSQNFLWLYFANFSSKLQSLAGLFVGQGQEPNLG